jgi:hypothetical protein
MLYLSARGDHGLKVFLGIGTENVRRIKADDPLMASMEIVKARGFLFLFISEDGEDSPKMAAIRPKLEEFKSHWMTVPISQQRLDDIMASKMILTIKPRDRLPDIEEVVILFCENPERLVDELRETGYIGPETELRNISKSELN